MKTNRRINGLYFFTAMAMALSLSACGEVGLESVEELALCMKFRVVNHVSESTISNGEISRSVETNFTASATDGTALQRFFSYFRAVYFISSTTRFDRLYDGPTESKCLFLDRTHSLDGRSLFESVHDLARVQSPSRVQLSISPVKIVLEIIENFRSRHQEVLCYPTSILNEFPNRQVPIQSVSARINQVTYNVQHLELPAPGTDFRMQVANIDNRATLVIPLLCGGYTFQDRSVPIRPTEGTIEFSLQF